jgi:LL-diaminopimelate aminotransferase
MKIIFEPARRVKELPPYLFLEIDRAKRAAREKGADIIDFGIGDPDQPTPSFVVEAFDRAVKDPSTHRYPLDSGRREFREAVAAWYLERFLVKLDPDTEILPLIGSKEGLTHLPLAFVNPGDKALVPDPAYPAYARAVGFAGGKPVAYALREELRFLPDWTELMKARHAGTKLMYFNYPNNPTGAVAGPDTFDKAVRFGKKHRILMCHDNAYSEVYFGHEKPASFLQSDGAKSVGLEFHSLSKTFNMTGWRLGFACGNADAIAALAKVKSNIDSGVFSAIQLAGADALKRTAEFTSKTNAMYVKRRNVLIAGLKSLGWNVTAPEATFYVWCRLPKGHTSSIAFSKHLLEKAAIVCTPGVGFGKFGEGYARFTLTVPEDRIKMAIERLKKVL